MEITLQALAELLEATFVGDGELVLRGVASIEDAGPDQITFAASDFHLRRLEECRAGAAIVKSDPGIEGKNLIVAEDPQLSFIETVQFFHAREEPFKGVSPLASVAEDAEISEPVTIGPFVSVGSGAVIGSRSAIAAGCHIGARVRVGEVCTLHPNVVLYDRVVLGDRTVIHSGSVIGADGFGYASRNGLHHKIPQVGSVRIGDDVEIGACVCVDRGALSDTVIGNGVKIDNLVQIGHNVRIGDGSILVSQVGISGSASIGKGCVMAGRSGLKDHVTIGDGVTVAATAVVTRDIPPDTIVAGFPAGDIETWRRSQVILRNLPKYWPKILELLKKESKE